MTTIQDPAGNRTWATPREFIDQIVSVHHGYLRLTLPILDQLTEHIAREHVVPVSLMDRLEREFAALADLLETHMAKQEGWIFPKIRRLREPVGDVCWACHIDDGLGAQMDRLTHDNHDALTLLEQIQACLSDRRWAGKSRLVDQFIEDIGELSENFAEHARLESNVLFPHVRELLQPHGLAV